MNKASMKQFMPRHRQLSLSQLLAVMCLAWLTAACSSMPTTSNVDIPGDQKKDVQKFSKSLGNIEYHTSEFADELFGTFRFRNMNRSQYRFAVATFVPVDTLKHNSNKQHHLQILGLQLEQGMMTEVARRGYIAQDYKATNNIIVEGESDRVFSREVEALSRRHEHVDFYLSGTIAETEKGAVVNARIIDVESKDVVAAATRYFPSKLFWSGGKVTTRDGMIYRSSSD